MHTMIAEKVSTRSTGSSVTYHVIHSNHDKIFPISIKSNLRTTHPISIKFGATELQLYSKNMLKLPIYQSMSSYQTQCHEI